MTVNIVDAKVVVLSRKILVVRKKKGKLQLAATIYFLYAMVDIYQKL